MDANNPKNSTKKSNNQLNFNKRKKRQSVTLKSLATFTRYSMEAYLRFDFQPICVIVMILFSAPIGQFYQL